MTASIDHTRQLPAARSAAEGREGQKSGTGRERTGGGVKNFRAQVSETFFDAVAPADPDYVFGCRAIGAALGLHRAATMKLIEQGTIHTLLIADRRCAKRSEIARYLAEQASPGSWEGEGGSLAPERDERTWTEASWRRRRRGRGRP